MEPTVTVHASHPIVFTAELTKADWITNWLVLQLTQKK
jgi:hypothetical protein